MPRKRPIRIAVVGIDGTGKTSAVEHLKKILGKKYKVGHLTIAPRKATARSKLGKRIFGFLEGISRKADKTEDRAYISISQSIYSQIIPFARIAKEKGKDIMIYERHPALDYMVYGKEYIGRLLSKAERLMTGVPRPDIIIYLDAKPEVAFSRILKRRLTGEKEYIHPHESSIEALSTAKERFEKVIRKFEKDPRVKVIRIDANKPLNAMLKELEDKIKKVGLIRL